MLCVGAADPGGAAGGGGRAARSGRGARGPETGEPAAGGAPGGEWRERLPPGAPPQEPSMDQFVALFGTHRAGRALLS